MSGFVYQINIKEKTLGERGLPKIPTEVVKVTEMGLEGDYNVFRHEQQNNSPDQAVLIMTYEMIQQLNEEGWPIKSGDIGENFTTKGLDYKLFQPKKQFQIGEIIVEITKACDPCLNLSDLPYIGKNHSGRFIRTMLNRRGWYAKVIREGVVKKGDSMLEL